MSPVSKSSKEPSSKGSPWFSPQFLDFEVEAVPSPKATVSTSPRVKAKAKPEPEASSVEVDYFPPPSNLKASPIPTSTTATTPATSAEELPEVAKVDKMSEEEALARKEAFFKARRWAWLVGGVIVAILVAYMCIPHNGSTTALSLPSAQADGPVEQTLDVAAVSKVDMAQAATYAQKQGTLTGYNPRKGGVVLWAHSGSTGVFSRSYNGTCVYYAVLDAKATKVQGDATGEACSKASMDQAAAQLKAQSAATSVQDTKATDDLLQQTAQASLQWASTNGGSFQGMPAPSGVELAATGTDLVLTSANGSTCRMVTVSSSSGNISAPQFCAS